MVNIHQFEPGCYSVFNLDHKNKAHYIDSREFSSPNSFFNSFTNMMKMLFLKIFTPILKMLLLNVLIIPIEKLHVFYLVD